MSLTPRIDQIEADVTQAESDISSNAGAISAIRQVPTGGSSGQFLRNNGGGSYSWATLPSSGGGVEIHQSIRNVTNNYNYTVPSGMYSRVSSSISNALTTSARDYSNSLWAAGTSIRANGGSLQIDFNNTNFTNPIHIVTFRNS
jgi:hypothetical protein